MSMSRQFAAIGLPQKKRPRTKKTASKTTTTVITQGRPSAAMRATKPRVGLVPVGNQKDLKAIDLPNASYALTLAAATNANVILMNIVQEGTSDYQRVGRRIEMASLHVTGSIIPNGTAQTGSDFVQWAVIYDRQPSQAAALPVYSTIFQDVGPTGTAAINALAGLNLDNRDRFVVLRNKRLCLSSTTAVAGTNPAQVLSNLQNNHTINEFINLKGLIAIYGATANPITLANIATGALYFVTQGGYAAGAQGWQLSANIRLKYRDQ